MYYQAGDVIGGRYRIRELIGAGGYSDTYLAVDMKLGERLVALKTFPHVLEHHLSLLKRKARLLASLSHPDILQVFDFVEDNSNVFLITEYAPLGTLAGRYPHGTIVPLNKVVSYASQVAEALQYLHDRGIIHRDVKPSNLFLSSEDKVLLGDLGLAIQTSSHFASIEEIVGTPIYMAPEQVQGKSVYASDQYALAVVAYVWLTGDAPFSGGSFMEIMARQLNEPPPSLRSKNPVISPAVEQVVMRALAKEPEDRFPSVQAFADALKQAWTSTFVSILGRTTIPSSPPPGPILPAANDASPGFGTGAVAKSPPEPTVMQRDEPPSQSLSGIVGSSLPRIPIEALRGVTQSLRDRFARLGGRRATSEPQPPTELSLYAIARADIEENNRVVVGKTYTVQAGISQRVLEGFSGAPFRVSVPDPQQPLLFDILIHADGSLVLPHGWYYGLRYDPNNPKAQFITCPFRAREAGKGLLIISFYRERQWLQTIRLEIEVIERSQASNMQAVS